MFRKITLLLFLLTVSVAVFAQQGTLKGEVMDGEAEEGVPFATVKLIQNGAVKGGATTDFDGAFTINSITPGSYDVEVNAVGYTPKRVSGVIISADKIRFMTGSGKIVLDSGNELEEVEVITYQVPLIDKDGGASGATITRDDIAKLPGRSAASIATTVGGVSTDANGSISSIRGARSDATYYYIDGIKVRGSSNLPKAAIQEVTVVTGGLPANYGDATGGIISVTTRGPSSYYFGGVDFLTSGLKIGDNVYGFDKYAYNLLEGSVSGPLVSKTDSSGHKEPLIGFFLSANFTSILDSRPFITDQYKLKDSVKNALLDPEQGGFIRESGATNSISVNNATDFLNKEDFELIDYRQNSARKGVNAAGKLDFNLGPAMNLTIGGSYNYSHYRSHSWQRSLLNSDNNPLTTDVAWRAYARFTHRFEDAVDEEGNKRKGGVKNVYYTLMADYSKNTTERRDEDFGDDLFKYGHIGKFDLERIPIYSLNGYEDADGNTRYQNDFNGYANLFKFTPDENSFNPYLSAISQEVQNLDIVKYLSDGRSAKNALIRFNTTQRTLDALSAIGDDYWFTESFQTYGGLFNGSGVGNVYSIWDNIGNPFNQYLTTDASQFRLTGAGSANIGNHAFSLGFEFEQRDDRFFNINPQGLWGLMRQQTNSHISDIDPSTETITQEGTYPTYSYDALNGSPGKYTGFTDSQSFFDYNLREALDLNTDGTDFLNPDAYDPSTYSLDMFSADELFNNGSSYVGYSGYDHTGKKVKNRSNYRDFFEETDEFGNYTRPINSFQPIYMAGYIMDKFAFDDLIFNLGVRVDRFDANQPVLTDQYSFVPTNKVSDLSDASWFTGNVPGNISQDAVVYVDDNFEPNQVNGYRLNDQWFDADGNEVSDPAVVYSGSGKADPWIRSDVSPEHSGVHVDALEDYSPQINVSPRISFSFPISDEALFFAHYDVLTQRPNNIQFSPLTYLYIEQQSLGSPIANPNLKPEKTIDYELGFQQVLSKSSSLKIASFYREQRDFITATNIVGAYPTSYTTYGNIDFGTVKGLTLTYDLRRTQNLRVNASYTLQFAEGTGSSSTSGLNFLNSGVPNFRTISPYSYDQRHQFAGSVDYRYGEGKNYNGPVIKGKQVLKNTGFNMSFNFGSGTPYSAQENINGGALISGASPAAFTGSLNGSRKPWQYRIDAQLDKNITFKHGKDEDNQKVSSLNIYLQINNIFSIINVVNVYAGTGNPDDDAFVNSADAQLAISEQLDPQSYLNYYGMKVVNPYNYSLPRTIRLGLRYSF